MTKVNSFIVVMMTITIGATSFSGQQGPDPKKENVCNKQIASLTHARLLNVMALAAQEPDDVEILIVHQKDEAYKKALEKAWTTCVATPKETLFMQNIEFAANQYPGAAKKFLAALKDKDAETQKYMTAMNGWAAVVSVLTEQYLSELQTAAQKKPSAAHDALVKPHDQKNVPTGKSK